MGRSERRGLTREMGPVSSRAHPGTAEVPWLGRGKPLDEDIGGQDASRWPGSGYVMG